MRNICICIKMHIPVSQTRYSFMINKGDKKYYDDILITQLVNKLSNENILPLLETIHVIFVESDGKFKAGISVSGITLALLQRLRPDVVSQLNFLEKKGAIEFLSEPWSHSFIPFSSDFSLTDQINQHDELIKSEFNKVPQVFFLHSTVVLQETIKTILETGKQAIFTNTGYSDSMNSEKESLLNPSFYLPGKIFMVNSKLSRLIEDFENAADLPKIHRLITQMVFKIKHAKPKVFPLIISYNPINLNYPFSEERFRYWDEIINQLLLVPDLNIGLPSEIVSNQWEQNTVTSEKKQ